MGAVLLRGSVERDTDIGNGFENFSSIDANEMNFSFDGGPGGSRPPCFLVPDQPIITVFAYGRHDVQGIAKLGAVQEIDAGLVDRKPESLFFPERRQGRRPNNAFSSSFEIFKIVGVVNHPGVVGIFVVNLDLKVVGSRCQVGHPIYREHVGVGFAQARHTTKRTPS